ncbi:MAG: substrate-binding domain-containing protein [Planctomycetota bacterium]|nr:MAG: substrate-binding domain-containing protein [Planctomycetota bacterium]
MKKTLVPVGLLSLTIILLTGCSQIDANQQLGQQQKKLRFIFISTCVDEDFFDPVKKGMRDAADIMGVECSFVGTEEVDIEAQVNMVKKAIADGYDGIALNIIHTTAFDDVVQQAIDKGIPVVAFNVDDHSTPNARLSAIYQKCYEAGRKVAEEASSFIPDNSKILMTLHSAGVTSLDERLRGEQDVLKEKGVTWKVVVSGIEPQKCAEVIARELKADPEIKIVLCTGQADTEGAGLAIEKYFKGKGYATAGFDLSPEILRMLKNGTIRFTIDQQPYTQGFYPVIQLALYCRYGIMPTNMDAGAEIVTGEIADRVLKLSKQKYR